MIRGQAINVVLPPVHDSDIEPFEAFVPRVTMLRNGRLSNAGTWERRPGYVKLHQLPQQEPVVALIPDGNGYAVTASGRVYDLTKTYTGLTDADQAEHDRLVQALLSPNALISDIRSNLRTSIEGIEKLAAKITRLLRDGRRIGLGYFPQRSDWFRLVAISVHMTRARDLLIQLVYESTAANTNAQIVELTAIIALLNAYAADIFAKIVTSPAVWSQTDRFRLVAIGARLALLEKAVLTALLLARLRAQQQSFRSLRDREQTLIQVVPGESQNGLERPTWTNYDGTIIICNGLLPMTIRDEQIQVIPQSRARFCAVIDEHLILAGGVQPSGAVKLANDVHFIWSDAGDMDEFSAENFNNIAPEGGDIVMMKAFRKNLYFWTPKHLEVWSSIGGAEVFARERRLERGTVAGHSVVEANDTFYWFADHGEFVRLNGGTAEVLSPTIRKQLDQIHDREKMYGIDFPRESVIRWFCPTEGRCFVYDYLNSTWSEDSQWNAGDARLPVYSMMQRGSQVLVGDYDQTGVIYEWSQAHATDNGNPLRVPRQFRVPLNNQGLSARVNRLSFRVKRGSAGSGEWVATTVSALVRWRFDEGDWVPYRTIDLGAANGRDPYVHLHMLGIGREIEIELVETDAVDWFVTHGYLLVEPLER